MGRVVRAHGPEDLAQFDVCTFDDRLADRRKVEVDDVDRAVTRVFDLHDHMTRAISVFASAAGTMNLAATDRVDQRADGSGQIDAVVEIPSVPIDARPE